MYIRDPASRWINVVELWTLFTALVLEVKQKAKSLSVMC